FSLDGIDIRFLKTSNLVRSVTRSHHNPVLPTVLSQNRKHGGDMQNDSFLTLPKHPCMITRLLDEIREARRQFRENPRAFLKGATMVDTAGGQHRRMLLQFGLAIGLLSYAAFAAILIIWSIYRPPVQNTQKISIISFPPLLLPPQTRMPEDEQQ